MTIRKALIAAGSAIALTSLATGAFAASVQQTAVASVTVISPVTVTKTADMAFGNVVRPFTGVSTITLNTNNSVTESGAGDGSVAPGLATSSARFDVTAPVGTVFTTTQGLSFAQPGLQNVQPSLPQTADGTLGTIPAAGVQNIRYGGSFDMTSSTAIQSYTGTLTVTVSYN